MHGTSIGNGGSGLPGGLSKVDEIHLKKASIAALSEQWDAVIGASTIEKCKTSVSKIAKDGGHFTLSSTSDAGIGTESAMVNSDSDVSLSSIDAIHIKRGFFRVLSDERGTRIGAGSASFNRLD